MASVDGLNTIEGTALVARAACEALFQQFGACVDDNRATDAIEAFADDAVLEVGGRRYDGREEILGFLRAREARTDRRTRHLGANFAFRQLTDDTAEAQALMVVFAGQTPGAAAVAPDVVSDCAMTFARHPRAGWRITSRRHTRFADSEQGG